MAGYFAVGALLAGMVVLPRVAVWWVDRGAARIMAETRANPEKHIEGWAEWEADLNARMKATLRAIDEAIEREKRAEHENKADKK
jgi:hypothetical protein